MSLESLSDHSVTLLYENIKQQVEADRPYKYRFTRQPRSLKSARRNCGMKG